ncbi:unnamed protein product [Periconia digitata]|uniref:Transmembrane protein n=1 Tax=Periconia digitata TaxID=1303443 RepID=A0A9W4UST2_9PLEO|nr:unnamed protein product [Periconia digitata]
MRIRACGYGVVARIVSVQVLQRDGDIWVCSCKTKRLRAAALLLARIANQLLIEFVGFGFVFQVGQLFVYVLVGCGSFVRSHLKQSICAILWYAGVVGFVAGFEVRAGEMGGWKWGERLEARTHLMCG